ncbi:MAG: putative phosphoribosyltransferase [Candidatus Methanohalarchaeum thermophilum]|uniref:Phosphoribosyltransferase n=1 Tax=Methanohalarchaeum thermophilum TaxID=1903181 RepID=A0A1Q6DWN7_METT1|nr:MAG: putative phosphoribosyltransferase [Candidatus Methanohalarchaeum thermophilum]
MMFKDREHAGKTLAKKLEEYREEDGDVVVLAIAKGGTRVGYEIAKALKADFSILVIRKLPFPYNPEAGFGAIAEDGTEVLVQGPFSQNKINEIKEKQREEIKRRLKKLRDSPIPKLEDKTVILVDDGIATGSTMKAAVQYCKKNNPKKIVVTSPVSSSEAKREFEDLVDDVHILETPDRFRAVAQVYQNWHDVTDQEVIEIMQKWRNN